MDWAIGLAERGLVPLPLARLGIRRLLEHRLNDLRSTDQDALVERLRAGPIAIATDLANAQHYELPGEFFDLVLGPRRKYSACSWRPGTTSLAEAELAALEEVCERARLADGQRILDLGCGWGALAVHAATRHPGASVVAVSNSLSQAEAIRARGLANLEVVTADVNAFRPSGRFDRIVSIEMLEHVRNQERLLRRLARWLDPEGRIFVHLFCHRSHAYPFETDGRGDWMARHFFTGGLMPSRGLLRRWEAGLAVEREWILDGTHYRRTAEAWRRNLESNRSSVLAVFRTVYGPDARRWYHRWRLFFAACEELFGYRDGTEWMVAQYDLTLAGAQGWQGVAA